MIIKATGPPWTDTWSSKMASGHDCHDCQSTGLFHGPSSFTSFVLAEEATRAIPVAIESVVMAGELTRELLLDWPPFSFPLFGCPSSVPCRHSSTIFVCLSSPVDHLPSLLVVGGDAENLLPVRKAMIWPFPRPPF